MDRKDPVQTTETDQQENEDLLGSLNEALERPMVILSFIMLGLFLLEIAFALPPEWQRAFGVVEWLIWVAFVAEFVVKLSLAENKFAFLRHNWLMTLSVALPVLRVFRVVRAARAARSIGTLRVVAVSNRTLRQLTVIFERRRLHYLLTAVAAVTVISGAGIYFIERSYPKANITTFGDGLWWSAGTITTVGTELYPVTAEGRVLAVLVMVFGVSVFGYIAGSLASLFVNIDQSVAERGGGKPSDVQKGPP